MKNKIIVKKLKILFVFLIGKIISLIKNLIQII